MKTLLLIFLAVFLWGCSSPSKEVDASSEIAFNPEGIAISQQYPAYWQYKGETLLLAGGSVEDNLFQFEGLEEELDRIKNAGGNYVRNTMSSRDSGNVWAFEKTPEGYYDLNTWNETYWNRFQNFLSLTAQRDIIVQIEVWATFDFYRDPWNENPFNPKNNINYNAAFTKIPTEITTHPTWRENNFFRSLPNLENNAPVMWQQQRFVDKLLSYSLQFDHVLYCIDNETSVTAEWGKFWARYIHKKAADQGKMVYVTEMWDAHDLDHAMHSETFDHPEIYDFVDISQNNHQKGERHWENGLKQIARINASGRTRPANNVKIYGAEAMNHGKDAQDAKESFWRNIFFGAAAVRFHRPTSGIGSREDALNHVASARKFSSRINLFACRPNNTLLSDREENEAYCTAIPDEAYAVLFTNGGQVALDLSGTVGAWELSWLQADKAQWNEPEKIVSGTQVSLQCPGEGIWVALIRK